MIRRNSISNSLQNIRQKRSSLLWTTVLFFLISGAAVAQDNRFVDSLRRDSLTSVLFTDTVAQKIKGKPGVNIFRGDTLFKSPWGAVGRSLVIPGWGQLYNDQPVKATVFLVSDAGWMMLYQKRDKKVKQIERQRTIIDRQIKTDPYLGAEQKRILQQRFQNLTVSLDQALNRRNLYGWLFALSHLLGMVDAFVDAHLYGFHDKMEMAVLPAHDGAGLAFQVTFK